METERSCFDNHATELGMILDVLGDTKHITCEVAMIADFNSLVNAR